MANAPWGPPSNEQNRHPSHGDARDESISEPSTEIDQETRHDSVNDKHDRQYTRQDHEDDVEESNDEENDAYFEEKRRRMEWRRQQIEASRLRETQERDGSQDSVRGRAMEDGRDMSSREIDQALSEHPIRNISPIHQRILAALFTNGARGVRHKNIRYGDDIELHKDWFQADQPLDAKDDEDQAIIIENSDTAGATI